VELIFDFQFDSVWFPKNKSGIGSVFDKENAIQFGTVLCFSACPKTAVPLTLSQYSFPISLTVWGWDGLGGWLHIKMINPRMVTISVLTGLNIQ